MPDISPVLCCRSTEGHKLTYGFRTARYDEQSDITDFLNKHWGEKHPLLNNERLKEHYFCDDGNFNFALCTAGEDIAAVAGFIYSSRDKKSAFISIWCADATYSGAGLELMDRMRDLIGVDMICCNNIRPKTIPFYEFLGYSAGKFTHAYMLADRDDYKLAVVKNKKVLPPCESDAKLIPIDYIDDNTLKMLCKNLAVKKDAKYIKHRYIDYPFAEYKLYELNDGLTSAVIAFRSISANGVMAIKLVDFIGEPKDVVHLGQPLKILMEESGAEFVEFYNVGISREILERAGFAIRDEQDNNIIPTYLVPPDIKNVDFYYFTDRVDGFSMYRADGDGDRPIVI